MRILLNTVVTQEENGSIIWMPTSENPVNSIGSMQRKFTQTIDFIQTCKWQLKKANCNQLNTTEYGDLRSKFTE